MFGTSQPPGGFAEFCQRDLRGLVTHLRVAGYDQQVAEDSAQEAMIELLGIWDAESVRDPRAWVRRVAGRMAAADVRGVRRRREVHALAASQQELSMPAHARSQGESEVEVVLRFFRTLPMRPSSR